MKEYNEQVVETLDDAGCIIANKNIIIDNFQARIAELEAENERLKEIEQTNDTLLDQLGDKNAALLDEVASQKHCYAEAVAHYEKQLAAAQEEITRLEKLVISAQNAAIENTSEVGVLKSQLAKANQLWQIAQGRCDGLEEKLAKAEQRVAEWQPIETAPKDGVWILCKSFRRLTTEQSREISWNGKCWATRDCSRLSDPTHWMPLPEAPNGASS